MDGKVFNFSGAEIQYSSEQLTYYQIRRQFKDLATQCQNEILSDFYNRFDSFDSMASGLQLYLKEYLNKGAVLCTQVLAERDHYELDPDRFITDFFDHTRLNAASSHFMQFVEAQQTEMDANEAERCERTDALGSMWQGGGFGLEGAIKGAVQAEALNLAGAAVSGIFNAAGRKAEAARMLEEQKVFFENPETPASVAQGVYDALAEMYIDLFRYVDKNCPEIQIKQLTADDISKSKSLLSNMQKGFIPDDKIFDHCLKVLMLNPLYTEAYEFILLKYPDCKHTILEMDEFFYIGVIRDMMYNQLDSFFATLDVSDEEKAWAARKTMADKATELGINNFQSYPELELSCGRSR